MTIQASHPLRGWFLSALSLLSLLAVFVFSNLLFGSIRREIARSSFEDALVEGNWSRNEQLAMELTTFQGMVENFVAASAPLLLERSPKRLENTRQSFEIMNLIHGEQVHQAFLAYQVVRDDWERHLDPSSLFGEDKGPNPALQSIDELFKTHETQSKEIRNIRQGDGDIRRKKQNILTQYEALTEDYRGLFSLRLDQPPEKGSLPSYYSKGVLKYLPRLRGVPDGIVELSQLGQAIEAARGSVKLESENPQEEFAQRFGSFQKLAQTLVESFEELEREQERVESESSVYESKADRTRLALLSAFEQLFLLLSEASSTSILSQTAHFIL